MVSNRIKKNIWLTLAILSVGTIIDRTIRYMDGDIEWYSLTASVIIFAFCVRFYLCFRREVKRGNLFGKPEAFNKCRYK